MTKSFRLSHTFIGCVRWILPNSVELEIDISLNSLTSSYDEFVQDFMNKNKEVSLLKLYNMLRLQSLTRLKLPTQLLLNRHEERRCNPLMGLTCSKMHRSKDPQHIYCFHLKGIGHGRHICPTYLMELRKLQAKQYGIQVY